LARQSHPDKQPLLPATTTSTTPAPLDFKRIQIAWETLRDTSQRNEYDHELLQHQLRHKSKVQGAVPISLDDLEEAYDDETQQTLFVYDCRCGEEIVMMEKSKSDNSINESESSLSGDSFGVVVECPGCCFVYKLLGKNTTTTTS
jgi:curved DNA-binding protein CbpA